MPYTVVQNSFGRFLVVDRDLISDHIREGHGWDADLLPVIDIAAEAPGTAIDAGAYTGFFTTQLARRFRRVISFEPQTRVFYNLCANIMLNGLSNIEPINKALYSHPGYMKVARRSLQDITIPMKASEIDYQAFDNHGAVAFELQLSESLTQCVTIDSLNLNDLAFLCSDCQGADFRVLRGAEETIKRCRPVIMFESEMKLEKERGISRSLYDLFFSDINYLLVTIRGTVTDQQTEYLGVPKERADAYTRYLRFI